MNSFAFSEKKIKVVRLIRIKIYKNRGSSDNPDNKGPKIIRIATFIFQNDLLGGFRGSSLYLKVAGMVLVLFIETKSCTTTNTFQAGS